jgi:hypothetical protein
VKVGHRPGKLTGGDVVPTELQVIGDGKQIIVVDKCESLFWLPPR